MLHAGTTGTQLAGARHLAHRALWGVKPVLREVYGHFYRRMPAWCVDRTTAEVGGGSGSFKSFMLCADSFDIVPAPWLDLVADAQRLPFAHESLPNIVMLVVLHHIEAPLRFVNEAERDLRSGGRIVVIEPASTPGSWAFFIGSFTKNPCGWTLTR